MATTVDKLEDLVYDELITLAVIENSDDLYDIFTDSIKMPFNILYRLQSVGQLNEPTKELMVNIFEKVILTREEYIEKYKRYTHMGIPMCDAVSDALNDAVSDALNGGEPIQLDVVMKPVPTKKRVVKVSPITQKEVPRRYGKAEILKDIQNQDGISTHQQRYMLRVNDLKNLYVNLGAKGIRDIFGGTEEVSEEYYRQVDSAIRTLEKLINVKKKK